MTLIHELAHGTIGIYGNSKNVYISEVEGWYFQSLGREFLHDKKIVDDKYINQLEYNDFSVIYDYYISIILYRACEFIKKEKKGLTIDRIKKVSSRYLNYLSLDEDLLYEYLYTSPIEDYTYLYSYLLSLDLESKYKDDPELSFYNFSKLAINNSINHNDLRNCGITFMDDNYKSFRNKVKKINTL